jgi:hypothetical protein
MYLRSRESELVRTSLIGSLLRITKPVRCIYAVMTDNIIRPLAEQ